MKATCHREGLLSAFQVASGVVPQRSPRPILRSVKLVFSPPDQATLLATDLEIGIRYLLSGIDVDEAGSIVLPVGETMSILRELPDERINLRAGDGGVLIEAASSRFELATEDPQEFPDVPEMGSEPAHRTKAGVLLGMIRRTSFACASENSRYALHSVLVEFEEGRFKFIATDSKRLAIMPGAVEVAGEVPEGNWLLPPKALNLITRVLADPEEEVSFVLRDNEALFRTGKVVIYTRLVEGRFPKYQDVIPPEVNFQIPLPVGPFYGVVRQSRILTNDESRGVDFEFAEGELRLESRASQLGQSEVRMPLGYSGNSIGVTYDPQLLIDALKVLDPSEEIRLELADNRRASVFRTRDDYAYVVMPLIRDR
ncbi:DNA polymerase III subunit beta [bacterium]|nr:DNA polymerase III subunit beta [bacterium]